jgi:16S rRNA processing protein RimM
LVTVARILRSQGQEGDLRVKFFYITPGDCRGLETVFVGREGDFKEYTVECWTRRGKYFDLKLGGVDSLFQADRLAGLEIGVPEGSLKERPMGEFFLFELIGCTVSDIRGGTVGRVRDVLSAGSGDLLVVEDKGKEILIPFHESICVEVDIPGKRIRIDPPEGLLNVDEI